MTDINPDTGLFAGLSKDDKATAILDHLSMDEEVTLQFLMEATGFSPSQVHAGIRHLREAGGKNCVITHRRGANSTYRLAENALDVRDYAHRRMRHWRTQMQIMQSEMDGAMRLLQGGEAKKVQAAASLLGTLLCTLDLGDAIDRDLEKRERALDRQEARLSKKSKSQYRQKTLV
jgi:hypothetical protein